MTKKELFCFNIGKFSISMADYTGGGANWGWVYLSKGRRRLDIGNYGIRLEYF